MRLDPINNSSQHFGMPKTIDVLKNDYPATTQLPGIPKKGGRMQLKPIGH